MSESGFLMAIAGPQPGHRFPLRPGRNVVGREETCEVALFDETSSRRHALVVVDDGGAARVEDLGSANGTRLNGERLDGGRPLAEGDEIGVGQTLLRYHRSQRDTVILSDGEPEPPDDDSDLEPVERLAPDPRSERALPGEPPDRHLARLQSICRVAGDLDRAGSLEQLCEAAAHALASELDLDRGAIALDDGPTWAFRGDGKRRRAFALSRGVSGAARKNGEALLFVAARDPELAERRSIVRARTSAAICVPLRALDETIGLLYLDRRERDPFDRTDLALAVDLAARVGPAIGRLRAAGGGPDLVAADPATRAALALVERAASAATPVLLIGETGVGKEVFARHLHEASGRPGPLVAINMAALPESLVESELFGHEAGAFTGADAAKPGVFRAADGGTLLLDEIGEMPLALQAKLLRALESGQFRPVGAVEPVTVDVRIVAATNRALAERAASGAFRQDLYYRLAVVEIAIPPLRERPADVPALLAHFVRRIASRLGREAPAIAPEADALLRAHRWPGNVRELRNVAERLLVLGPGDEIRPDDLPESIAGGGAATAEAALPVMTLKEAERWAIVRALAHTGGKKGETAKLLGTSWPTLNKKIREYEIDVPGK